MEQRHSTALASGGRSFSPQGVSSVRAKPALLEVGRKRQIDDSQTHDEKTRHGYERLLEEAREGDDVWLVRHVERDAKKGVRRCRDKGNLTR
jgi:DNA invertase Pin-like site-specific DNA recombinase